MLWCAISVPHPIHPRFYWAKIDWFNICTGIYVNRSIWPLIVENLDQLHEQMCWHLSWARADFWLISCPSNYFPMNFHCATTNTRSSFASRLIGFMASSNKKKRTIQIFWVEKMTVEVIDSDFMHSSSSTNFTFFLQIKSWWVLGNVCHPILLLLFHKMPLRKVENVSIKERS